MKKKHTHTELTTFYKFLLREKRKNPQTKTPHK